MHSVSSAYHQPPQRQYTLGGDGYGNNSVPPLPEHDPYSGYPPGLDTTSGATTGAYAGATSPVRGPRPQPSAGGIPDEAPPGYDQGGSSVVGQWDKH
jgi:hypothetical protein